MEHINQFLNECAAWAYTQPDIQAIALVGSHARNAATETSDIDLVVIASFERTPILSRHLPGK